MQPIVGRDRFQNGFTWQCADLKSHRRDGCVSENIGGNCQSVTDKGSSSRCSVAGGCDGRPEPCAGAAELLRRARLRHDLFGKTPWAEASVHVNYGNRIGIFQIVFKNVGLRPARP